MSTKLQLTRVETSFSAALRIAAFLLVPAMPALPLLGQVLFEDISPDNSDTDDLDPDGATGGRVNHVAIHPDDNQIAYAASEWGGLYKSIDGGLTWSRLDGHLPVATWDVAIDHGTPSRVYATSFYDGRTTPRSGINISTDDGATWSRPASALPPAGFCADPVDEAEPSAFGISVDPVDPANVFIATSCGLAVSGDSGATWTYIDPTGPPPAASAIRYWDVHSLGGGVVHVCGDDGYLRSDDGGGTWIVGAGLPSGRCSLAVSPDEAYVLFAVVGTSIFESVDNGATWAQTRSNPSPQGRIPFVATNQRSTPAGPDGAQDGGANVFDLWFGDVSLFRVQCTTPAVPAPGGSPRCGTGAAPPWAGPFTRDVGGHDDMGSIVFDPEAADDACPLLMSSDGGIYYNLDVTPDCHNPNWEQPDVTPHGLWPFSMSGSGREGVEEEDLYFGNQDNGLFGTVDAGGVTPSWHNEICCDGFDTAGDSVGAVYSVCCFGGAGRATRIFRTDPGFFNSLEINTYPPGGLSPTFDFPDSVVHIRDRSYVMLTRDCTPGVSGCEAADGGVFVTQDIDADPIVWTELGDGTEPPSGSLCGVQVALNGLTPTLFVQSGSCNNTSTTDRLFRFTGLSPLGTWTELFLPSGGFGIVAVHPNNPNRLLASALSATAAMFSSVNGGIGWTPVPALDDLMTGGGAFLMRNRKGPTNFTGFNGYWQPSLVAFDPLSETVVAGGQDSGIFLSADDGATWEVISDPLTSDVSGVPHIPRPRYAYFDSEPDSKIFYIGSQGRGIWRLTPPTPVFEDGFETGDTSRWSSQTP